MIELPFIPGILILLIIFIGIIKIYMELANFLGERIRMFFTRICKLLKLDNSGD